MIGGKVGVDLASATTIKALLETNSISTIVLYAQKGYPNECCGFMCADGVVFPANNIIDTIGNRSISAKTAFLIDPKSWEVAVKYKHPIRLIYHSHTNGDTNMSAADIKFLKWPDLFYLIVGLIDTNPIAAKLYWWQNETLYDLPITL